MATIVLGTKMLYKNSKYGKFYYTSYNMVLLKDATVKIETLDAVMTSVLQALQTVATRSGRYLVITSGNDFSGHKVGSYHYKNRAIDVSFKAGLTGGTFVDWASKTGSVAQEFLKLVNPTAPVHTDFDVLWEADHVHIEYDPHDRKPDTPETPKTSGEPDTPKKEVEEIPIQFCLTDLSIKSLGDLISYHPLFKNIDKSKLESYRGPDGKTNKERIEASYNNPDEDNKTEEYDLLKPGTVLYVLPSMLQENFDTLSFESSNQLKGFRSWGQYAFEEQKDLEKRLKEGKYVPSYAMFSGGYSVKTPVKYINSFFRVWIYSKAENAVVDVSQFVKSLSTSTATNGGDQFVIELAFLNPIRDSGLQINQSIVRGTKKNGEGNLVEEVQIVPGSYEIGESVYHVNSFLENKLSLFARKISENDIVFLSFEELEDPDDYRSGSVAMVDLDRLHDQYYDFLGLVATVQQSSDVQGSGVVTIAGQSLSKMLQDDEAVFRPIAAIEDSLSGNLLIGDRQKRGWKGRLFADGEYHSLFTDSMRTIGRTMKFYLNLVSNVGLLPLDEAGAENNQLGTCQLFTSWGDERTKLFKVSASEDGKITEVEEGFAKGLYQIIKLRVQPELENRHLSDGTICNPEGTILSLLQATCQQPLVELLMDTYKNSFDLICRVPPFSKKAILESIENLDELEKSGNSFSTISAENVYAENLSWETNFYTWFELHPKGSIIPVDGLVPLCYIPTLFLTNWIDVWGSRRLSVVSPYTVIGSNKADNLDEIKQAIQDLCWLVESNFYLPFTRRGTITLAVPDRRIKKGQWIRYKKTGEIFYVEGVEQTASVSANSVSRQTVLTVSRGLLEKFVNPGDKEGYFDIIDFDKMETDLKGLNEEDIKKNTVSDEAPINQDLFMFFCGRQQFNR